MFKNLLYHATFFRGQCSYCPLLDIYSVNITVWLKRILTSEWDKTPGCEMRQRLSLL